MSETATARARLERYCVGNGVDVGAGGDPIVPWAVCIDRQEDDGRRAHVGQHPTHLKGDATNLYWFKDESLDFLFSSHCLEDFLDTAEILKEWLRVIRPLGYLVLFLPDQPKYAAFCAERNALPNQAHKHADFSLAFVRKRLEEIGYGPDTVAHEMWPVPNNPYSFDLVIQKKP